MSSNESSSMNEGSRPRSFSLRTLIITISLMGAALGWIGIQIRQYRNERQLITMCIQAGATISYTGEEGGRITELFFSTTNGLNDDRLQQLSSLSQLRELWLVRSEVTGTGLAVLADFPALRELHIGSAQLSDDGLRHLKRLGQLKKLTIWGLRHDDPRVDELRLALPNCQVES